MSISPQPELRKHKSGRGSPPAKGRNPSRSPPPQQRRHQTSSPTRQPAPRLLHQDDLHGPPQKYSSANWISEYAAAQKVENHDSDSDDSMPGLIDNNSDSDSDSDDDDDFDMPILIQPDMPEPFQFTACTSTLQVESDEVILQHLDAIGPRGTLPPSLLPHGPEDPPDPNTVIKTADGWSLGIHPEGSENQRSILNQMVKQNQSVFSYGLSDLPGYKGPAGPFLVAPPEMSMPPPIPSLSKKARRWSPREVDAASSQLDPLVEVGIVKLCHDPTYATNMVIVPKKDSEGKWTGTRLAIDWRWVNKVTPTDPYSIPLPDRLFTEIGNAKWFSKLDMRQGFLQCSIPDHLQHLTAFWWKGQLWQYTRCGYGMKNSPAHFQRVMDRTLQDAGLSHVARAYIDDVLIASDTFEEHLLHVEQVLKAMHAVNLKVHPEKSVFGCAILEYLGHDVSQYGLTPSKVKIQAIQSLPDPNSVESLRRVLGFAN